MATIELTSNEKFFLAHYGLVIVKLDSSKKETLRESFWFSRREWRELKGHARKALGYFLKLSYARQNGSPLKYYRVKYTGMVEELLCIMGWEYRKNWRQLI
jgi:hypothetical protein